MKLLLRAIEFDDYRNIAPSSRLVLEPITTLVGANEAGKTNLIRSIQLLREEFNENDTKIGSSKASRNETPILKYFFEIRDESIASELEGYIKDFSRKKLLCIIKSGDSEELKLADRHFQTQDLKYRKKWKNCTENSLKFSDIEKGDVELHPNESVFGNIDNRLSIAKLAREKKVVSLTDDDVYLEIRERLFDDILPEVEYWEFDEEEHYLPDHVFWEQFLAKPDDYLPVQNLFSIACNEITTLTDFKTALSNLKGRDHEIQQYLDDISRALDRVIKKTWRQSNIKLQLFYQTDKLRFDIYEGGRRTRPSARSDGLKWFLSFLLDFRSRGELENKIILFDQPGEKLHPGGQKELRERFTEIALKNQIVFSTQSPFLIDRNSWSKVKFLQKTSNGDSEVKQPTKFDVKNDELLRYSLGYSLADVGQANDFNVVVEGYTDQTLLLDMARRLNEIASASERKPIINLNRIAIFDVRGHPSIKKRVDELLQAKLKAVGLYDGDEEGKKGLAKDKKAKRFRDLLFSLDEMAERSKYETAEDLIPQKLWETGCKTFFRKNSTQPSKKDLAHPRWKALSVWHGKATSNDISRKQKAEIWETIFESWDDYFDGLKDLLTIEEIKIAKTILENLGRKFSR